MTQRRSLQTILFSALALILLAACGSRAAAANPETASSQSGTATPSPTTATGLAKVSATPTLTPTSWLPQKDLLSSTPITEEDRWKSWPVLPSVSDEWQAIYQAGLAAGNDSHAFSVLGDCQSQPEVFMGVYDADSTVVGALPVNLQETVANFTGSFNRHAPTVKDATTSSALLWGEWNDNPEGTCSEGETPLDCELRVHKPSIVFIHIGTHWETRNYKYMSIIIQTIIDHKAVPVIVTKADDRELDDRINRDVADLAEEFNLPVWNFWGAVQSLPYEGIDPDSTWELSEEAAAIHRFSGLAALDIVWRELNQ